MKKRFTLLIFLFILICLISFIAYSNYTKEKRDTITGETVTGEITEANLAITITVSGSPSLIIISPENETYITNKSILLNYTATGEDSVWYNIDGEDNTTITSATYFNITEGLHTLYLYANNSEGNTTANVTFTVNLSLFTVLYNEYAGSTKGSSTDFNKSSYEDLQDLSGIVLENTNWGKIQFYEAINITNDSDISDNEVDLDTNTNISENRIELNSTALPNFNTSATLYLYNLTLDDPRILRDGSVCPDTICTEIDYSGGTLTFNVTQFTVYSAEETPSEEIPPTGGGGGITVKKDFTINLEEIIIKLRQGETTTRDLIIINDGSERLSFSLEETPAIEDFLKISKRNFDLEPSGAKVITLDFLVREETIPNLYLGKLVVKADGIEKEILIGIEVTTKGPLFDVRINLPERFMWVMPGDGIFYNIEIFDLAGIERPVDVFVEHRLLDIEGNEVLSKDESVAVMTRVGYTKEIKIPEYVQHGRYVIYVKVTYAEEVASASVWFNVGRKPFPYISTLIIVLSLAVLIIIILIIIIKKLKKKKLGEKESFKDYKKRLKERLEKIRKAEKIRELSWKKR